MNGGWRRGEPRGGRAEMEEVVEGRGERRVRRRDEMKR